MSCTVFCVADTDRSAREAEEKENLAISKGETLPTEKRFDSNCITPGTTAAVMLYEKTLSRTKPYKTPCLVCSRCISSTPVCGWDGHLSA